MNNLQPTQGQKLQPVASNISEIPNSVNMEQSKQENSHQLKASEPTQQTLQPAQSNDFMIQSIIQKVKNNVFNNMQNEQPSQQAFPVASRQPSTQPAADVPQSKEMSTTIQSIQQMIQNQMTVKHMKSPTSIQTQLNGLKQMISDKQNDALSRQNIATYSGLNNVQKHTENNTVNRMIMSNAQVQQTQPKFIALQSGENAGVIPQVDVKVNNEQGNINQDSTQQQNQQNIQNVQNSAEEQYQAPGGSTGRSQMMVIKELMNTLNQLTNAQQQRQEQESKANGDAPAQVAEIPLLTNLNIQQTLNNAYNTYEAQARSQYQVQDAGKSILETQTSQIGGLQPETPGVQKYGSTTTDLNKNIATDEQLLNAQKLLDKFSTNQINSSAIQQQNNQFKPGSDNNIQSSVNQNPQKSFASLIGKFGKQQAPSANNQSMDLTRQSPLSTMQQQETPLLRNDPQMFRNLSSPLESMYQQPSQINQYNQTSKIGGRDCRFPLNLVQGENRSQEIQKFSNQLDRSNSVNNSAPLFNNASNMQNESDVNILDQSMVQKPQPLSNDFNDQINLIVQMITLVNTIQTVQQDVVQMQLSDLKAKLLDDCGYLFKNQDNISFLQNIIDCQQKSKEQEYQLMQHQANIEKKIMNNDKVKNDGKAQNALMQVDQKVSALIQNPVNPQMGGTSEMVSQLNHSLNLLNQLQQQQNLNQKNQMMTQQHQEQQQVEIQASTLNQLYQQAGRQESQTQNFMPQKIDGLSKILNEIKNQTSTISMAGAKNQGVDVATQQMMLQLKQNQQDKNQQSNQVNSYPLIGQHQKQAIYSFDQNMQFTDNLPNQVLQEQTEYIAQPNNFNINMRSKGINKPKNVLSQGEIVDKGDYEIIHKYNPETKRMNQILQCKHCPLKFPKLCNLRDHVRIHQDSMPFKCKYCKKSFTQAGNRDRHQSKYVCMKRTFVVGAEALKNAEEFRQQ